jgi:hypothetical protein
VSKLTVRPWENSMCLWLLMATNRSLTGTSANRCSNDTEQRVMRCRPHMDHGFSSRELQSQLGHSSDRRLR